MRILLTSSRELFKIHRVRSTTLSDTNPDQEKTPMATTTTVPITTTIPCQITYDFDLTWVTVKNVTSSNALTLNIGGVNSHSLFTGEEQAFFVALTNLDNNAVTNLKIREMRLFKRMCEKTAAKAQPKGAVLFGRAKEPKYN